MKTRNNTKKTWGFPKVICNTFLVFIMLLFIQLCYLSLSPNIYGINMKEFSAKRNTVKTTLYAKRGNVYDIEGNVLAQNVTSYTVIAYLSESRTGTSSKPLHVVDKKATAEALAPILNMEASYIEKLLNKKVYQVELGPGGRGISELTKEEIENLNLPGIDFIENYKRFYPNGDFASYIVGYAKQYEEQKEREDGTTITEQTIVGELGIESKYNELLSGKNGYLEYQRDLSGFKIPDTPERKIEAENGYDVYLTIDSSIQRFVEDAVKVAAKEYNPELLVVGVMDAKNGDILASATYPSFDPNVRNITNYENILTSYAFEPGSTMKTYTYMCALEKGTYNGNATFSSGSYTIGDDIVKDWNTVGWGTINYDKGYEYSSNVGIANMLNTFINKNDLKECLEKFGFGKKTGIELSRELSGNTKFTYPIEVATAGFGQGITTTAIQQLQGLTIIANDGKMLKPHIVKKIINSNTNEIYYESKKEESEQLVSLDTVNKMRNLMYNVVNSDDPAATGKKYKIDGFDIIGKTGTAQVYDDKKGGYKSNTNDYIYSFAGMFPKDNPEIIIYMAIKRPDYGTTNKALVYISNSVIRSIAKYKNMFSELSNTEQSETYEITDYSNLKTSDIVDILKSHNINPIELGSGDKIVNQYPSKGTNVISGDLVVLVTNDSNISLPDFTGYSKKEFITLCNLINLKYKIEGYGYVSSQSIAPGTSINEIDEISVVLKEKYDLGT